MNQQIPVEKRVFGKDFSKIVNTQFTQFTSQGGDGEQTISIEDFFKLYEDIFYSIPKEGIINSHRYILQKEADYLNVRLADDIDVQALLDEITTLRQELLDANKILNDNNLNIVNII